MILSATPEKKNPEPRKIFWFSVWMLPDVAHKPTDRSRRNSISRALFSKISLCYFVSDPSLKLRVVYIRNKKWTEWQTWNFTNMINCFCCYVIKSAGETAKSVLLSVIWNLLLIEINLFQIRISGSKREKVCAVCPYLLFYYVV